MSRSTRRSTTSTRYPGWILQLMEDTLPEKSLISLNALRWSRSHTSIRELKSFSGRLLVTIRKMKCFLIEIFSLKGALLRWRSWMFDDAWGDLDWISEEKYNLMKEKINKLNMPNKKKKNKKKNKKKKKAKKKKKR